MPGPYFVKRHVLKHAVTVGKKQVDAFLRCKGYPNNRLLREAGARPVFS
jgi:hypothetical protein